MWRITGIILVFMFLGTEAGCKLNCTCYLDDRGRNTVVCDKGGIVGSLSLEGISTSTEVLKIIGPEDNSNMLTMSPVFDNYQELEEIHITGSNIPQLGKHFFARLSKLDVLNLSLNNITQPLDHSFRGLSKLKELYLDDNRIHSLPSGTFRFLSELEVLSIQRNRIKELTPRIFLEIKKLKVLKLNGNQLTVLHPEVFKDVQVELIIWELIKSYQLCSTQEARINRQHRMNEPHPEDEELRSLECRGCALKQVDKEIYSLLTHLIHLDLGDNELTRIPSNEFRELKNLQILKLDGNQITAIRDDHLSEQTELRKLNLARNSIVDISKNAFLNLRNLTQLNLGYNKFEYIDPDVFANIAGNLEVLILNGNEISLQNLRDILHNLYLRELHIADCGIFDVPMRLFPDGLSVLNLAANYLTMLSPKVLPEHLTELDISRNRFKGLDEELLKKLDTISVLKLQHNPWSCDFCNIIPMLDRVNKSKVYHNVVCAHPYSADGKKLGTLERKYLTWCTPSTYAPSDANYFFIGNDTNFGLIVAGSSVCLLFLTLLVILMAFCYSRRHAAKYYTHEDKLSKDGDAIFETHSPLFCEERELSFKFPMEGGGEKRLSISTIDEIKKEHATQNGT